MDLTVSSSVSQQLSQLIQVSWLLLIPVALMLVLVLHQLWTLLQGLSEFMSMARYELYPAVKDLRAVANHLEVISAKAVVGAETVEKAAHVASKGVDGVKSSLEGLFTNTGSFLGGLVRSFIRQKS